MSPSPLIEVTEGSPASGSQRSDPQPESARALAWGFGLLAALTYGLVVLGALVRANGAGLACPDWPLCFGEVVPSMNLKVAFEWGHRAIAGFVGLVFAALSLATLRNDVLRRALWPGIAAAATLLAVQVVLGALTVWELLASWTVTSHLVTGNAFLLSLALLAWQLGEKAVGGRARTPVSPALRIGIAACAAMLVLQMVLGGLVASRFIGLACSEWPTCSDGIWFPTLSGPIGIHLFHRMNAYALALALAGVAFAARGRGRLSTVLLLACGLVAVQVVVGIANVLWMIPMEITGLHSALAAALVLATGSAAREAWLSPTAARDATPTPAIDPGSATAR